MKRLDHLKVSLYILQDLQDVIKPVNNREEVQQIKDVLKESEGHIEHVLNPNYGPQKGYYCPHCGSKTSTIKNRETTFISYCKICDEWFVIDCK